MFHVEPGHITRAALLADAKPTENLVEHIFWIDPPGDPAEAHGGLAQIFGAQFKLILVAAEKCFEMPQASPQVFAMARLGRSQPLITKCRLGPGNDGVDQASYAIAPLRRDP